MGMTKEQQKESARRIMEKLGPFTPDEEVRYRILVANPEEYVAPDPESGERVCGICGEVFQEIPGTKESHQITALDQYADHMATHNPTASQWTEAHRRIQSGKESSKRENGNSQSGSSDSSI